MSTYSASLPWTDESDPDVIHVSISCGQHRHIDRTFTRIWIERHPYEIRTALNLQRRVLREHEILHAAEHARWHKSRTVPISTELHGCRPKYRRAA